MLSQTVFNQANRFCQCLGFVRTFCDKLNFVAALYARGNDVEQAFGIVIIAVEFDYTKLRELESQAQNIREQLQRLGG